MKALTLLFTVATWISFSSDPSRDPQLVGKWRGDVHKNAVMELRKNGSYTYETFEAQYARDRNVRIVMSGTWRTERNKILFKTDRAEATGLRAEKKSFETFRRRMLNKEVEMPYKWINKNEWWPTKHKSGHFIRVK